MSIIRDIFLKNITLKAVSVFIAIVLWIVVLGSRTIEVVKEVPLEIITPPELISRDPLPERVSFRLVGPKAFLRAILDRKEDPILVNLQNAKAEVVQYRFFPDNIRLPLGVKVLSIQPPVLNLKLEQVRSKEVPFRVELQGHPESGYHIGQIALTPSKVQIHGHNGVLEKISEIVVGPLDVTNKKQSFEIPLKIDWDHYQVKQENIQLFAKVEVIATVPNFKIKNIPIKVLTDKRYILKQKTISALVRVSQKDFSKVQKLKPSAIIDLRGKPPGTYDSVVQLNLQGEIGVVKTIPDKITVQILP